MTEPEYPPEEELAEFDEADLDDPWADVDPQFIEPTSEPTETIDPGDYL